MNEDILKALSRPFHPSRVTWKPGAIAKSGQKALALAYADLRAYQDRLDQVCGMNWSVTYSPWGDKLICHLTIDGVTRSSTGEADSQSERSEIEGTATEAQAFKRACAMFGLGRYLYNLPSVWAEYDSERKQFTEQGKARLASILTQHYKRWEADNPGVSLDDADEIDQSGPTVDLAEFKAKAQEYYGADNCQREMERLAGYISKGRTNDPVKLTQEEVDTLVFNLKKKIAEAQAQSEDGIPKRPDWSEAAQAWEWAVQVGAFPDLKAARDAWREMIRASFPNGITKETSAQAYDMFFEQYSKIPA